MVFCELTHVALDLRAVRLEAAELKPPLLPESSGDVEPQLVPEDASA